MDQQLVLGEGFGGFKVFYIARRVEDALCAYLECRFKLVNDQHAMIYSPSLCSYQRNNVCGLIAETMSQLFIILYQMRNIDVAIVLFRQHVLPYLVSASLSTDFRDSVTATNL